MLTPILDKKTCAACRFCCSFRRVSMWETPIFTAENLDAIRTSHPAYQKELKTFERDGIIYATYDLSGKFMTENPEEEVPCPFLDPSRGCILTREEKPWDCKIWPLRVVKPAKGDPFIALTPTCQAINGLDAGTVRTFVKTLEKALLLYAEKHPYLYKSDMEGFLKPPCPETIMSRFSLR